MASIKFTIRPGDHARFCEMLVTPGGHKIPPTKISLDESVVKLEALKIEAAISRWQSVHEPAEAVGRLLFAALMPTDRHRALYRGTLEDVRRRRAGRRSAVLSVELALPDSLRDLPWELAYDHEAKEFLFSQDCISSVRIPYENDSIPSTSDPITPDSDKWRPPLRLLVVVANPCLSMRADAERGAVMSELPLCDGLSLDRFLRTLRKRCGGDLIDYELLCGQHATAENLEKELKGDYDVLYYVGHSHTRDGRTLFMMEDGSPLRCAVPLDSKDMGQWLAQSGVRLVVLSSCSSQSAAADFARVGRIGACVGMSMDMPIVTGAVFNEALLESLTAGLPLHKSVQVARTRITKLLRSRVGVDPACATTLGNWGRVDWAIPIFTQRMHAR